MRITELFDNGQFVVTAEVGPPKGIDASHVVKEATEYLDTKRVCTACDTYALPGYQGVTPLEHDCDQCGECFLNLTGGICPLTACSKSLVNGQCGGAKNGKCEVDPDMDCGWERIYQKLKAIGRLDALKCPIQIRNYATDELVK